MHDLAVIKELYWLLDTDAVHFQPEHFVRTERPDDFLLGIINHEKSAFLLLEVEGQVIGFGLEEL